MVVAWGGGTRMKERYWGHVIHILSIMGLVSTTVGCGFSMH